MADGEAAIRIESSHMRSGDRILFEPADGEPFEAVVVMPIGWSLVHNVMDWRMRRVVAVDDEDVFTTGIPISAEVQVLNRG